MAVNNLYEQRIQEIESELFKSNITLEKDMSGEWLVFANGEFVDGKLWDEIHPINQDMIGEHHKLSMNDLFEIAGSIFTLEEILEVNPDMDKEIVDAIEDLDVGQQLPFFHGEDIKRIK